MKYRLEIDGLRALAVLPVILFHAGVPLFKGGYVGVDIFFVISGYLITTILLNEVQQGKFSLKQFYERRFRRILPALFFVLACTYVLAYIWLIPAEMKVFSQSIAAVTLFSANMLFWLHGGYFDGASELKPLLHTWSLGVEEQFYLFFPLLLWLWWRLKIRHSVAYMFAVLFLLSLVTSEWMVQRDAMSAFYLLPFRAWELLAGSFAAYYLQNNQQSELNPKMLQIGSLAGLLMILVAMFFYDKGTLFPGLNALLPVTGTVFIILFATPSNGVGKLLSIKPMVQVGLISYSAYLWHNPLFAFARIRSESHIAGDATMWALSALSLVLAYFTWKYVEAPFRDKTKFTTKAIFKYSIAGSVIFFILGVGGHFYFRNAELSKFPEWEQLVRRNHCLLIPDDKRERHDDMCYANFDGQKNSRILLWGDSHAASLYQGLKPYADKNNMVVTQLNQSACPPILDRNLKLRANCSVLNNHVLEEVKKKHYDLIVLHSMWFFERDPRQFDEIAQGLEEGIHKIKQTAPQSQIVLISNTPRWHISADRSYYKSKTNKQTANGLYSKALTFPGLDKKLEEVARKQEIGFISPTRYLCDSQDNEYAYCLLSTDGSHDNLLYIDRDHMSRVGAEILVNKMAPDIQKQIMR